jgi:hypothetical protein
MSMSEPDGFEAIPVAVAMALGAQLPPVALAHSDPETGAWFVKPHIASIALPPLVLCGKIAPGAWGYKCGRERHADPWHLVIQSSRVRGVWRDEPKPAIDMTADPGLSEPRH